MKLKTLNIYFTFSFYSAINEIKKKLSRSLHFPAFFAPFFYIFQLQSIIVVTFYLQFLLHTNYN